MPRRIVRVDAFADRPFVGNPAAVCVLDGPRPDSWMQLSDLVAYLASSRGGVVRVRVEGECVRLGGRAVTVLRNELIG